MRKFLTSSGPLRALQDTSFALLAGALLISYVGVWMREATSAWILANAGYHNSAVTVVQAAVSGPTLLLALPAGVLADRSDRRRLLIWCQLVLILVGAALAVLGAVNQLSFAAIFTLTLLSGAAAALAGPAFEAIVPSLVQPRNIPSAIAISSISFNIARIIGPGAAGLLLLYGGPSATYACNAFAYVLVVAALLLISPTNSAPRLDRQVSMWTEQRIGIRYVWKSRPIQRLVARGMVLYACAACYLSLTPLIARDLLAGDSKVYSLLLSSIGAGSVIGGIAYSLAQRVMTDDRKLLRAGALGGALALSLLAIGSNLITLCAALAIAGATMLIQMVNLNSRLILTMPPHLRGRGIAIYMAATFGCMASGSLLWGMLSDALSLRTVFALGAICYTIVALVDGQSPKALMGGHDADHEIAAYEDL
ncbi:MFS transporter [Novosphingobium terrae]|uniref:MFS transporter n=1 Tax=Novosphingobium terrae TaxID=2726189 RepID=UPI00198173C2|nr:MFS transporter [Novosphingobium terrae]